MLPRKSLISLKTEFPRLRQVGKVYDSPSFGLVLAYGKQGGVKAAFIVSKKIDRRSTVRHEVKRKLAASLSPLLPRLTKGMELLFLAKQKAILSSRADLQKEVELVLHRAGLL